MCEVLFITPNVPGCFSKESLGTLLLATILKDNGISCKVLPMGQIGSVDHFDQLVENAIAKVGEIRPKIVSMYTRCDTFHISLKLAEEIKAHYSDICIVFGGPQSDTTSADLIAQVPYVDYACCGEGENTIYPFFHSLLQGQPDLSIPGLVYRQDGAVVKNPRPELIQNLDTLPMINYQDLYFADYPEDISSNFFQIDVGRGCPFGCAYCSTQAFWGRKYRLKSPARIFEEAKAAHRDFGVTRFIFSHDMFTFNRKMVIETCNLLRTLDFPIQWECSARLDCLDKELIDIMVDAGMIYVFVGIETGSKRMQKLVHKNLNLDKIMDILIHLRDKNIHVDASFIYGFPEETTEDISNTLALMTKIIYNRCGLINTHLCTFLPKTELSEQYQSQLVFTKNYTNFTGDIALKDCEDIIQKYPDLFPQLKEYQTEVRTSLKYFALFIRVWMKLTPVYQYISERYTENNMIDMYYEFVKVNHDALEKYGDLILKEATAHLVREDKLHLMLENDPNFDLLCDYRRMYLTETSDDFKSGKTINAVYCFNPQDRAQIRPIQEYERCVAVVTYADQKMSTVKYPYTK